MGCAQTKHSIQTPFACGFGKWIPRNRNVKGGKGRKKPVGVNRLQQVVISQESGRGYKREGEGPSGGHRNKVPDEINRGNGIREAGFRNGWPLWLIDNVPREILSDLFPKTADSYHKLAKIGQGAYSIVYKARDRDTGKIVALKRICFDVSKAETVKFVAREILILWKLDHPNVIKLEGIATSRDQYCIYLTDLNKVIKRPDERLTESQVKCYMLQLLAGLRHCHEMGVLHRDIKACNLLIGENGILKIADFGLANIFEPKPKSALTNRVVTLWYRAPELLLGSTDYGVGIDLWSVGCLLAEMLLGRPILPGRTEVYKLLAFQVEQLHKIFKLCGTPSDDYVRRNKLPRNFKLPRHYEPRFEEVFRDISGTASDLMTTLLSLEPADRGTAISALQDKFFSSSPLACDLSDLPVVSMEDNSNQCVKRQKNVRRKQMHKSNIQGINGIALEQYKGVFEPPEEDQGKNADAYLCRQEARKSVDKGPTAHMIRSKVKLLSPSDLQCPGLGDTPTRGRRRRSSSSSKGHAGDCISSSIKHSSYSLLSSREIANVESDKQSNILRRSISMANFGELQSSPQTTKLYFSDDE
ncbi:hypothetical protein V2J09_021954 [Rumex salicifolius]